MLVHGREFYGIGTIARIYAEAWPEMTTVCMGEGPHYDWLCETGKKVELVEGLAHFPLRGYGAAFAAFPRKWRQAKQDALRVHERLADRGVRIIHTQRLPQQLIAGHLRRMGYKSVWQINNNTNRRRFLDMGRRFNERLARWGADLLLPASDFIKQNWQGSGVPVRTIRNAAAPLLPALPHLEPPPPVRCLVVGRLQASKGHHVAVEAVLAAREAGHDVRLDIYGGPLEDNPCAERLRQRIDRAAAGQAIQFRGFCDNLREMHPQYHLGLQCRIDPEPCSLWVCETLVDGLPLVASATGGTPELVVDGETGVLVPPEDADALAREIIKLCQSPERLGSMRRAAFERGQANFTTERMLAETLQAYQLV